MEVEVELKVVQMLGGVRGYGGQMEGQITCGPRASHFRGVVCGGGGGQGQIFMGYGVSQRTDFFI